MIFMKKTVLHVGAGIGQLIGYATTASHLFAVENNKGTCQILRNRIDQEKLTQKVSVIEEDFYNLSTKADVVLFEYCLHEMINPAVAAKKAKSIAKEVVVIDHQEDSP